MTEAALSEPRKSPEGWLSKAAATLLVAALPVEAGAQEAGTAEAALPVIEVTTPAEKKQTKYPTPARKKSAPPALQPVPPADLEGETESSAGARAAKLTTTGISVIGDEAGLLDLSGSGNIVSGEQLYTSHVFTTNEALRAVPGIHVRDEEGFGMRPNISIRGLNPTRSTKTLLLEDGLFLTFAPYGDNASYFHPTTDRFEHIEVIKGADQLLYGPHTISGAINYVTPNPPAKPGGFAAATVGNRDYFNGQLFYGGWYENFGGLIDYVHKEGDGARDNTHHDIEDAAVKGIWQMSPESALILKGNVFAEDSQVTYSGITDAEMRNFGIRYNPFKNDTFNTERYAASATHNWDITSNISVASSVYWNTFSRDWWRQSSTTTDTQCTGFPPLRGAGLAVDPDTCNSIQGRLRDYETYGFDQRFTLAYELSDYVGNTLKTGYRIHKEEQDRLQVNRLFITGGDTLVEDNSRETEALSFFAQNRIDIGPFSVTPAFRYEDIENTRRNNITAGGCAAPPCTGTDEVSEFIPGISVGFAPSRNLDFFAGAHEGFAPPRVEDSISNTGGSIEVDAEKSTNVEVGMRSMPVPGIKLDATYFRNDFDNLVAVGSIAGGSVSLAQGEALFEGLELFGRIESGRIMRTPWSLYAQAAWTYLWTAEQVTPFLRVDNGQPLGGDTTGNRQPYAPEHLVTARIGYAEKNFDAHIEVVYVGEQFADFQNFERPEDATGTTNTGANQVQNSLTGIFGKLDAYTVFNLGMTYTYEPTNTDVFVAVKNVFDEEYIVDRTRGILPGAPRLFHVGVKQSF